MLKDEAYWKKRNKRTDKFSAFLDDAIGISDIMNIKKPQKKAPAKKKKQRPVTIVIDGEAYPAIIHGSKPQSPKKKTKANNIPSWI